MPVDLTAEFEAPNKVAAPDPVDLVAEFDAPPKKEQYAVVNDAVDKAAKWRNSDASGRLGMLLDGFKDHFTEETKKTLTDNWEKANKPIIGFGETEGYAGEVPAAPNTPTRQIQAGVYNAVGPLISSFTSPLNLGTLGLFGALTKLAGGSGPAAQSAQSGLTAIKAAFAAQMAKGAGEAAGKASVDLTRPEVSTQEKVTDVVDTLAQGAFALLAGHSATVLEPSIGRRGAVNPRAVDEAIQNRADVTQRPIEELAQKTDHPMLDAAKAAEEAPVVAAGRPPVETDAAKIAADRVEYDRLQGQMKEMGYDKVGTDEFNALWQKSEDIKNRHGGMPPTVEAAKPVEIAKEFEVPAPETPEAKAITEELERPKLERDFEAPKEGATAVMNAVVDQERVKRGLEPAMEVEARSDPEAWEAATKRLDENPSASAMLVDELKNDPRAINDVETALIRHQQIELQTRFDQVADSIIKAQEAGDTAKVAELGVERDRLSNDLLDTYEAGKLAGTETARGLRARRVMQNEDFSLARMVTTRRAINDGRPLTPEQMSEVQSLHKKIAETQKAFDEYVAKAESAQKAQAGTRAIRKVVVSYIGERANEARARIKARMAEGRSQSGLDPADIADHAIVGADYIARGVDNFATWSENMVKEFGERVKPHLQAIFDKAKSEVDAAEAAKREDTALKSFKTRTTNRITDLERRVHESDFSRRQRIEFSKDAEANALQAKLDAAKEEYAAALERDRYNSLSNLQKAKEQGIGFYDMARTIMTTGELSFILRQGKMAALSHPIMSARTLPTALKALLANPEAAHALNLEVLNHPDYAAAKAAKLHLLEKGQSLNKQEEILMAAQLAEKVPVVGRLVRAFNQSAEAYLNRLRFDLWRSMRDVGGLTAAEDRQLAKFVNESTGRGTLGALEPAAVPLGRIMFSPRYFASRLQLLVGHSMWGGTPRTRKIIAKEYARALIAMAAYYGAWELRNTMIDDEKKKAKIGTDPRSTDFGKIKIGDTRLDPLAGLSQMIVFGARTASGEKANTKGQVVDIRGPHVPYGGDKWSDVAANFARSKLHPVPGAIVNLFNGTDLAGNKADIANQALNLSAPLTYMDVYQALEEQDLPDGVALGLLAMLGEGLQTYGKKKSKASPIPDVPVTAPVSPKEPKSPSSGE